MRSGRGDRIFAGGVTGLALIVPLTLAGITLLMVEAAWPSITTYGFGFLTSSIWDPVKEIFGAAAYLYGTIVTTATCGLSTYGIIRVGRTNKAAATAAITSPM